MGINNNKSYAFPKKILLGLQEGKCNLSCPKCYTYGINTPSNNKRPVGLMDFKSFEKILDEAREYGIRIAPQTWDEPLLNSNIIDYLRSIKKRELPITMDTNGHLLTKNIAKELVSINVDSIFISVDAVTSETYKKVRGNDFFEKLKQNIHNLIDIRSDRKFPRIGVSFVIEKDNQHEVDSFIDYWSDYVDVIRTNQRFKSKRDLAIPPTSERTSCWSLYDSLMIHPNGDAALCCVDTHYENTIGNVFDKGIKAVWNGPFFEQAREWHEKGQYQQIKICKNCQLWSNELPKETIENNLLIKSTLTHTYYNRKDRLDNICNDNRFI